MGLALVELGIQWEVRRVRRKKYKSIVMETGEKSEVRNRAMLFVCWL